jgi:hypothetical protein
VSSGRAAAAGAERYRRWRMYIGGTAHAFDPGWLSVDQMVALNPLAAGPAARQTRNSRHRPDGGAHRPRRFCRSKRFSTR